jgi:hypothetical protein
MKEVWCDGFRFTLTRVVDARLSALKGGLRAYHQPPLGQTVGAPLEALIARPRMELRPGVPVEGLGAHLGDPLERAGKTRDQAERGQVRGMIFRVPFGVCHQGARVGRRPQGRQQGVGALLKHLCVRGVAIPTLTHPWHPTVLRDHALYDGLFQVRTVIFGVAMRDGHRVLITSGHIVASQGNAGGVKLVEAFINAFLGTDGQGQFAQPQVTTIGVDLIERATARNAVEPLRTHALTTQEIEGFVGKKRWGSRQGTSGTPHAIEDHPGNRFARGDLFLVMEQPSRVDHLAESYAFDHRSDDP